MKNQQKVALSTETKTISNLIEETVSKILQDIFSVFQVSYEMRDRAYASSALRLVIWMPFAAGCELPAQCASQNAIMFLYASLPGAGHRMFDHCPTNDRDIFDRLRAIMFFRGGDQAVLDSGMAMLGRMLCEGYHRDIEKDGRTGEYNPYGAKAWDIDRDWSRLSDIPVHEALREVEPVRASFWL